MKRYFYLWHRWLGIGLCLLMALWFVSGMVMLYVGYPKLTPAEHLAHLPELPARDCCIDLPQVFAASGRDEAPQSLRLSSTEGRPRYLLGYADGSGVTLDALDGRRIAPVDEAGALASARQFDPRATAHYLGLIDEDAWTHSRALDGDRPLHRVQLDDAEGRQLYISSHSGAVVRDATRTERAWNWIGAWLHWLYPLRGPWWSNLVIYSALAATAMALLGQVVGVLRWRFSRPYRSGSRSPYRGGFARWHHIVGLLFGGVVIAWIFSGLMSMRPWHLLDSQSTLTASAYQGGACVRRHSRCRCARHWRVFARRACTRASWSGGWSAAKASCRRWMAAATAGCCRWATPIRCNACRKAACAARCRLWRRARRSRSRS